MNNADISAVMPAWSTKTKAERDTAFREYQRFMLGGSDPQGAERLLLKKRDSVLRREWFLQRVASSLQLEESILLFGALEDEWLSVFQCGEREDNVSTDEWAYGGKELVGTQLALDTWASVGALIMGALVTRDPMMALSLVILLEPISLRLGRAATAMKKSNHFCTFASFILSNEVRGSVLATVPFQHSSITVINNTLWVVSPSYMRRLVDARTLDSLVDLLGSPCCPSLLEVLGEALQNLARAAAAIDDPALASEVKLTFRRASRSACARLLGTDMRRETLPAVAGSEVDISKVVGPLATLVQHLAIYLRITVPVEVRKHIKPFGDKYTEREPSNPVERSRWSDRFVAMRVAQLDWADPGNDSISASLVAASKATYSLFHKRRLESVQCAGCRKNEDPNGAAFKKCSRCKTARYCSAECQKGHWRTHKRTCVMVLPKVVPARKVMSIKESIDHSHPLATAGGNTMYPTQFVTWLVWRNSDE